MKEEKESEGKEDHQFKHAHLQFISQPQCFLPSEGATEEQDPPAEGFTKEQWLDARIERLHLCDNFLDGASFIDAKMRGFREYGVFSGDKTPKGYTGTECKGNRECQEKDGNYWVKKIPCKFNCAAEICFCGDITKLSPIMLAAHRRYCAPQYASVRRKLTPTGYPRLTMKKWSIYCPGFGIKRHMLVKGSPGFGDYCCRQSRVPEPHPMLVIDNPMRPKDRKENVVYIEERRELTSNETCLECGKDIPPKLCRTCAAAKLGVHCENPGNTKRRKTGGGGGHTDSCGRYPFDSDYNKSPDYDEDYY